MASLQRLFFEEVRRSGDPNAAAAAALLRLAEESRPMDGDDLTVSHSSGELAAKGDSSTAVKGGGSPCVAAAVRPPVDPRLKQKGSAADSVDETLMLSEDRLVLLPA